MDLDDLRTAAAHIDIGIEDITQMFYHANFETSAPNQQQEVDVPYTSAILYC